MSATAPIASDAVHPVPGRECGTCSMCCKVYNIAEIEKPAGKWCTHCKPGKGCVIHDARPQQCAEFNCMWRLNEQIPDRWKPDQAKMVTAIDPATNYIIVQVDTNAPSAWRKQPYIDDLRLWAKRNLHLGMYVLVGVNNEVTLILPDQEIPLGKMKSNERISLRKVGNSYQASLVSVAG